MSDWSVFEHTLRAWGNDGDPFPSPSNAGPCLSGACRVWDWRLRASDTVLRAFRGTFAAGAPCPVAVDGDRAITDNQAPPNTFLVAASEIVLDDVGDDDGLCESNEACLFAPNLGPYHGEGSIGTTCDFRGGLVQGTVIHGFPTNGVP